MFKGCQYEESNATGHPFDLDVFSDENFLPSDASNKFPQNINEDPTSKTNSKLQITLSTEKTAAEAIHFKIARE